MAFWGVYVQPGQPYTLQLDGDEKRLRISQATLGGRSIGIWTSRSSLQCAVGSKPPVFICSVSNELPCCRLDLEFEESEEIVFSIKGPRGIHLSGYYVTPHAAERANTTITDDLRINCNGEEEINNAENDKERKLMVEEEDIDKVDNLTVGGEDNSHNNNDGCSDVFIDASDLLVKNHLQELNAGADENNIKQQEISCSSDSFLEREDEYVFCIRKSDKTAKNMIRKDGEHIDSRTSQPNNTLKDTGTVGIGSKGKADLVNRLGEHESEKQMKEIIEGCRNPRTLNTDIGNTRNIDLEGDEVLQARSESNGMCQKGMRNQQSQESSLNMAIGVPPSMLPKHEVSSDVGQKSKQRRRKDEDIKDQPRRREDGKPTNDEFSHGVSEQTDFSNNLVQPSDVINGNSEKTKKRKKHKVSKRKSLEEDSGSFDVWEKIEQRVAIIENVVQVLPENCEEGKPACDKSSYIYSRKKKKKQKTNGDANDENLSAKSSQVRTISNEIIIEELRAGEPNGKVAAPGKKVKVFYITRLMDTGNIVESNVGQAPFKFCIGDEKIIEGWNVGIDGMHIGQKRRLTIPPSMGHGKRFLEIIPPNSWMVCDIELVGVR